jgi:hypothetical protein
MSYRAGRVLRMGDRPVYTDGNPPRACGNGHRLGPDRVLLSFLLCHCDKIPAGRRHTGGGHRTWTCRVCGHVTFSDGHTDDTALVTQPPPLSDVLRIDD